MTDRAVILSSGRCGSTLLSLLLEEESRTLSVSESLRPLIARATSSGAPQVLTGAEYWDLLSRPTYAQTVLAEAGFEPPPEVRYPRDGRRAGDLAHLPPILGTILPSISTDPDALFDELALTVPDFPRQEMGQQHGMLLDRLAARAGRDRWVERTGASGAVAGLVLHWFPTARYVHLTRDPVDTGRSMSRHPVFQMELLRQSLRAACGVDPYAEEGTTVPPGDVPESLRPLLPPTVTRPALQAWAEANSGLFPMAYEFMTAVTEQALADFPGRPVLTMTYEELCAEPAEQLERLGRFLDLADPRGWATRAARRVRAPRTVRSAS